MTVIDMIGPIAVELLGSVPPILFALILCMGIETLWPRDPLSLADRLPAVWFILAMPLFAALVGPWLYAIAQNAGLRPMIDVKTLPFAITVMLIVIVIDFLAYWEHRFEHRYWWRVHAVHHATRNMHAGMNYGHPIQYVGEFLWIGMPLFALGLGEIKIPLAVTIYRSFHSMLNHSSTPFHLGPLRRVFVDNRYHRIHHSADPRHFGHNFGTIFTVWDQVFGTAYFPADNESPDMGVHGLDPPSTFGEYLLHPLRKREVV